MNFNHFRFLTLFSLVLLLFSCGGDGKDPINIDGTYTVQDIKTGGKLKGKASGKILIAKQAGDTYKITIQSISYRGASAPLNLAFVGTVKAINDDAFEVKFAKQSLTKKIPFNFTYTLSDAVKMALGVSVDKVVFEDTSKKLDYTVSIDNSTSEKISYGGKQYACVVQKNKLDVALNIGIAYKLTITKAQFVESIKDTTVKTVVKTSLAYTGSDAIQLGKKAAIDKALTNIVNSLNSSSGLSEKTDWVINLTR